MPRLLDKKKIYLKTKSRKWSCLVVSLCCFVLETHGSWPSLKSKCNLSHPVCLCSAYMLQLLRGMEYKVMLSTYLNWIGKSVQTEQAPYLATQKQECSADTGRWALGSYADHSSNTTQYFQWFCNLGKGSHMWTQPFIRQCHFITEKQAHFKLVGNLIP